MFVESWMLHDSMCLDGYVAVVLSIGCSEQHFQASLLTMGNSCKRDLVIKIFAHAIDRWLLDDMDQ